MLAGGVLHARPGEKGRESQGRSRICSGRKEVQVGGGGGPGEEGGVAGRP